MSILKKIGGGLKKAAGKYKEWEAKAPQRQATKLKQLKDQEKRLKVINQIKQKQESVRKLQQQTFADNPFMGGGMMLGPSMGQPFGGQPVKRSGSTKKKKPRKRVTEYF